MSQNGRGFAFPRLLPCLDCQFLLSSSSLPISQGDADRCSQYCRKERNPAESEFHWHYNVSLFNIDSFRLSQSWTIFKHIT